VFHVDEVDGLGLLGGGARTDKLLYVMAGMA
jgi:hypothetical protein